MKTLCLSLFAAALATAPIFVGFGAESNLDQSAPALNNPLPGPCGVILDLPQQVQHNSDDDQAAGLGHGTWDIYDIPSVDDDDLRPVTVTGTAGPTGGQLSLEFIQGAETFNGILWLDSEKRQAAPPLTWPVAANSTLSVTLFIEGYLVSKEWNDVHLRAAISCPGGIGADGKTYLPAHAEDLKRTSVVRKCGIVMEPQFDNPKWFYAAKVENGPKCVARAQYVVTWKPRQAMGVFDPGGRPQENLQPLPGVARPGECRMLYVGPRLGRRWVTKAFWCYYNDPCGVRPGLLGPSDMGTGWALLGGAGAVVNPNKKGPGGDPPPPIPPPVPEEDPPGADGGGSVRDFATGWEPFDNPDIRESEPPLPDAEEVEIVAEIVAFDHSKTGFRQYLEPLAGGPVKYFLKETAATSLAGGNPESPVGGSATREVQRMTGQIIYTNIQGNPSYYGIDTIPAGATVDETSFTGTFQVDSYDDPPNARQDEPGTMGASAILADEYTLATLKQDVFDNAWTFRDIFRQEPAVAHLDVSDDQESVSYAKLRYKIRVPERYPRPYQVSWVEEFTPEDPDPEDDIEPEKEYQIRTATISAGASETAAYQIDPATEPDKQGQWQVKLLEIEDASLMRDSSTGEFEPLCDLLPSVPIPEMSMRTTHVTKTGTKYRVGVQVEYRDSFGEVPGNPANDIVEFYAGTSKTGEVTGLAAGNGEPPESAWQSINTRRVIEYEYELDPAPGIVGLSVRTPKNENGDIGIATAAVVLGPQDESTAAPPEVRPALAFSGEFDPGAADSIRATFPGGPEATLLETGAATLVFAGQATVAGMVKPAAFNLESGSSAGAGFVHGVMEIGSGPAAEKFTFTAVEAARGSGSFAVTRIERRLSLDPQELPTLGFTGSLDPATTDALRVRFPGESEAVLTETGLSTACFSGTAAVAGISQQIKIAIDSGGTLDETVADSLESSVSLEGTGSLFRLVSAETAPGSREFAPEQAAPYPSPDSTAVVSASSNETMLKGGGVYSIALRVKVPKFLAELIEQGKVSVSVNGLAMPAKRLPGWEPISEDPDNPVVWIVQDGAVPVPFFFCMWNSPDGVKTTGDMMSAPEFKIEIGSLNPQVAPPVIWDHIFLLGTEDDGGDEEYDNIEGDPGDVIESGALQATFPEKVEGWYLAMFGPYGELLLERFREVGGTIEYGYVFHPFGLLDSWRVSDNSQIRWNEGHRPKVKVDVSGRTPERTAGHLFAALDHLFNRDITSANQITSRRPPPTADALEAWDGIQLEPADRDEYNELAASEFSHVVEIVKDTETAARLAVSVANQPLDVVVTVCDSIDEVRNGQPGVATADVGIQAGLAIAATVIKSKLRIARILKKDGVIHIDGRILRFSKTLLARSEFHEGLDLMLKGNRVAGLAKFKILVDAGVLSKRKLAQLYDHGLIPRSRWYSRLLGKSPYRILEKGITDYTGVVRKADERTHHCFPLGNYKFKDGTAINLEREFVMRGIDPNVID